MQGFAFGEHRSGAALAFTAGSGSRPAAHFALVKEAWAVRRGSVRRGKCVATKLFLMACCAKKENPAL